MGNILEFSICKHIKLPDESFVEPLSLPYSLPLVNLSEKFPKEAEILLAKQGVYQDKFLLPGFCWLFRKSSLLQGYWVDDRKTRNNLVRWLAALGVKSKNIPSVVPVGTSILLGFLTSKSFPGILDIQRAIYAVLFAPEKFGFFIANYLANRYPIITKVRPEEINNFWEKYFFYSLDWVIESLKDIYQTNQLHFSQYLSLYPNYASFGLVLFSIALLCKGKKLPAYLSWLNILHSYLISSLEQHYEIPLNFFVALVLTACAKKSMLPVEFGLAPNQFKTIRIEFGGLDGSYSLRSGEETE